MATREEAEQALLDAIQAQAKLAGSEDAASYAVKHAAAAAQMAEAYAWLRSPNQPHGGAPGFGDT